MSLEEYRRIIDSQKERIGRLVLEVRDLKGEVRKLSNNDKSNENKTKNVENEVPKAFNNPLIKTVNSSQQNSGHGITNSNSNNEIIKTQRETINALKEALSAKNKLIKELERKRKK